VRSDWGSVYKVDVRSCGSSASLQRGGRRLRVAAGRGSPPAVSPRLRSPGPVWQAGRRCRAPFPRFVLRSKGTLACDPKIRIAHFRVNRPPSAERCGYHIILRSALGRTSPRARRKAPRTTGATGRARALQAAKYRSMREPCGRDHSASIRRRPAGQSPQDIRLGPVGSFLLTEVPIRFG
jgi:hypothetical protein